MNISHNKRLQRHETCNNERVLGVITKKCISCIVPAVTICAAKSKSRRQVEITLSCAFQPVTANNEKVSFGQKYSRLIKMDKKLLAIIDVAIKFDATFTSRKRSMEGTLDIIKMKRRHSPCSVAIKEPCLRVITIRKSILARSDERNLCRAQVTVLTSSAADVNFYRCLKRMQVTHPKRYPTSAESASEQAYIVEENNMEQKITSEVNCASEQLFSQKVNADEALSKNDKLILSGHSLFEKYVKYKRDKLKRMHSEPIELGSRESSYPLAASELMRACAVRILEPIRQVSYITAPSRSRLGSVEVETILTPARTYREQLLSINYRGLKNSPVSRSERSMSLTRTSFEFDTPLSPFEQSLQNQAFQLRKISALSNGDIPTVQGEEEITEVLFLLCCVLDKLNIYNNWASSDPSASPLLQHFAIFPAVCNGPKAYSSSCSTLDCRTDEGDFIKHTDAELDELD
ncbi:hypothetical protein LOAG_00792 [Loa loa]|uniref:Uncharacterized protein n=2 Tax=Loa loa TaxID=7209 RepID=A0A1S0UCJ2_LOALO|nr:hypothetical protein LOAG_00792 [Loa loa]EFO27697.2 hypothetical protein LOAG_00792 [Loa loa]